MTYDQWKTRDPNDPFADHEEDGPTELDMVYEDNARLRADLERARNACASVWLMLSDTGNNELRLIADECRAALGDLSKR